MTRPSRLALRTFACLALGLAPFAAAAPTAAPAWDFDVVRLKNGATLRGLIVGETETSLQFQNVRRSPGRPTVVFYTVLRKAEIDRTDRLDDAKREQLRQRIAALDPGREGEQARMEQIELTAAPWGNDPAGARRYDSDHFGLTANAPEEVARRAAIRLEEIYAAYARFLPPRHKGGKPTEIVLVQSLDEYQKMLRGEGRKFQNPAFYDPASNRILCASDLERLGKDLESVRQKHNELLADLDRTQAGFVKLYKGKELEQRLAWVRETRLRVANCNTDNDAVFDRATRQLFGSLYHEAFHSYVSNFVYPAGNGNGGPGELPRWFNEGLAQVFETAIVEAGELRVGHAERDRLLRAKQRGGLVGVADLMRAGPRDFLVVHAGDRPGSDRAYLTAWALAFYLTFERRVLGTPAFDAYLARLNGGGEPVAAFEALAGQPLDKFEGEFHLYVRRLQPDGSLSDAVSTK